MNTYNTTVTSASSNESFLPIKKRMVHRLIDATTKLPSDLTSLQNKGLSEPRNNIRAFRTKLGPNGATNNIRDFTTTKDLTSLQNKALVPLRNRRWGARIYINQRSIWLGTFRSFDEAASAYNSASIKLGKFDANSTRNVTSNDLPLLQREFQKFYTTKAVLNMIKDRSYPNKFREFLNNRSHTVKSINTRKSEHSSLYKFLFQKELTPSDVGSLNKLEIPKRYAVRYLPYISIDQSEREEGEIEVDVEEVEVVFYDKAMQQWKFRYCYCTSSQSFFFTRGWSSFVKEKKLKEKDVIVFYTCESCDVDGQSKKLLIIDVHHYSENSSVVPVEINKTVHESSDPMIPEEVNKPVRESSDPMIPEEVNKPVHESSDPIETKTNVVSSKLKDEETISNENKGGIMLFGTWIQAKPNQS